MKADSIVCDLIYWQGQKRLNDGNITQRDTNKSYHNLVCYCLCFSG